MFGRMFEWMFDKGKKFGGKAEMFFLKGYFSMKKKFERMFGKEEKFGRILFKAIMHFDKLFRLWAYIKWIFPDL